MTEREEMFLRGDGDNEEDDDNDVVGLDATREVLVFAAEESFSLLLHILGLAEIILVSL